MELTFRFAQEADTPLILRFIRDLAEYEHMADQVVADEATLKEQLFDRRGAEVLFALENGKEVGFALFFGRICTSCRSTGARGTERLSSAVWPLSPGSGAAAAWSGGAWTGMPPASPFTAP